MNTKLHILLKFNRIVIVFLLLLFRSYSLLPVNHYIGAPFIKNYPPQDYFGNLQNWDAVEDHRGILYIANNFGVLEFDGQEWRLIPLANNSFASSLAIDQNQVIYVGGVNEIGKLVIDQTGYITYYSLMPLIPHKYSDFSRVFRTIATNQGVYFISNHYIFYYSANQIKVISELNGNKIEIQQAYSIDDAIYLRQKTNGLFILNNLHMKKIHGTEMLNDQECGVSEILKVSLNSFLIITEIQGLFEMKITVNSDQTIMAKINKIKSELESILSQTQLYTAVKLSSHLLAIGTSNNGIILSDFNGNIITLINKKSGLQNNIVNSIYIDSHQNMWALLNIGLSFIDLNATITKIAPISEFDDAIISMHHHNKDIFIGTFDGIYHFPPSNFMGEVPINKISNCHSPCFDFVDYGKRMLAGGRHLYWINNENARLLRQNLYFYSLAHSEKFPRTVFAGTSNGLHVLTMKYAADKSGEIILEKIQKLPETHEIIRNIVFDSAGQLWLTTEVNGIIHLNFSDPLLINYSIHKYGKKDGLESLRNCFIIIENNEILIHSNNKFFTPIPDANSESGYRLIQKTDSIACFFNQSPKEIYQIESDFQYGIWANTDAGFGQLLQDNSQHFQFNTFPFKQIKGKIMEFMIDSTGLVWISSFQAGGLFVYNPRLEETYKKSFDTQFKTLIRKVTINSKEIIFNGTFFDNQSIIKDYYSKSSLVQPNVLKKKFPPDTKSIQIRYAVPFFQHTDEIYFKYKLSAFDNQWSNWTNKAEKEYTNLAAGNYMFCVFAKNLYQFESGPAVFSFEITPFWHNTLIFRIGMVFGIIALVALAVIFHFKRMKIAILNERKKYENTFLLPEKAEKYLAALILLMEKERPYRNPEITLNSLSEMLAIPSHHLSQIINDKKNMNFNEFINNYRINEAKEQLLEKQPANNIIDIAFSVGFNSKSAFYIAFKKHTGITPSQYKKQNGIQF